ncbi:MAG: mechanosensitive ion channel family protein [Thermotogota bacterium]
MTTIQRLAHDLPNPGTMLGAVFYAVILFATAWLVARTVKVALRRSARQHGDSRAARSGASFVGQLAQIGIYLVALTLYAHIIPSLRHLGTPLLASVGVVSVVLGIAAQHTLGNLAAGVAILLYHPFRVGDQVQVAAPTGLEMGFVESLTLGYTILRTYDNRRIVIPNSLMTTQVSINLSAVDARVVVTIPFTISYRADIDRARSILIELATAHPHVLEVIGCPVTELGASGVRLSLRAWCATMDATYEVHYDLLEQAKQRFEREGIEIPFPSMNVVVQRLSRASGGKS